MATLAGAKSRLDAFADRRAEGAIARQRLAGRAGQAAEDAGGGDADIGLPVIAFIAGDKRLVEGVVIWKAIKSILSVFELAPREPWVRVKTQFPDDQESTQWLLWIHVLTKTLG